MDNSISKIKSLDVIGHFNKALTAYITVARSINDMFSTMPEVETYFKVESNSILNDITKNDHHLSIGISKIGDDYVIGYVSKVGYDNDTLLLTELYSEVRNLSESLDKDPLQLINYHEACKEYHLFDSQKMASDIKARWNSAYARLKTWSTTRQV